MQWIAGQLDDGATWEYVRWIRENWTGKLILKGILDPRDAVEAVNAGADAISVSNHGGTQLDGAPSAISMLPLIVDAVAARTEILFDSGVRSGQDVLKALALGARAMSPGPSLSVWPRGEWASKASSQCSRSSAGNS